MPYPNSEWPTSKDSVINRVDNVSVAWADDFNYLQNLHKQVQDWIGLTGELLGDGVTGAGPGGAVSPIASGGDAFKLAARNDFSSGKLLTVGDDYDSSYSEKFRIDYDGKIWTGAGIDLSGGVLNPPSGSALPSSGMIVGDLFYKTGSGEGLYAYSSTGWALTGGPDSDAIHDNVAGEIAAIAAKAVPTISDYLVIEDAADSNNKKSITIDDLPAQDGVDSSAIHDDTAGEIAAVSAKATPTTSDYVLIEDAADSNNKKSMTIGDLPAQDGADSSAIHDDVAGEIAAVASKGTPTISDRILIEDAADSNNKKSMTLGSIPAQAGLDSSAIHVSTSDEYDTAPLKNPMVALDRVLIEDSENSYSKKYAAISGIPAKDGADSSAIHDDTAGEIAATSLKASPTTSDYLLIEDNADSNNKKSITISSLPAQAGGDSSAIHDDTAGEINAVTLKATPVDADVILIEDSEAAYIKKKVTLDTISGGGGGAGEILASTNVTATMGSVPSEENIGAFTFDGSTSDAPNYEAVVEPSAAVTYEIRLYDRGPAAGPAEAAQLVSKLVVSTAGIQTVNKALTPTATPTFTGSGNDEIYDSDRMYVVRIYISGSPGDSIWIGKVGLTGDLADVIYASDSIYANLWCPPATPHALDDEFDGDVVDPSWLIWNHSDSAAGSFGADQVDTYDSTFNSGNVVRSVINGIRRRSWLIMQAPVSKNFYVYKPITLPTNILIMSRLKFCQNYAPLGDNDRLLSLSLWADTTGHPDIDNQVSVYLNESDVTTQAQSIRVESGANYDIQNSTDTQAEGQALEYVAVHKIGSTYHSWVGTASGNWIWLGSTIYTGPTLAYVGYYTYCDVSSKPGVGVIGSDFIRFYETDNFLF